MAETFAEYAQRIRGYLGGKDPLQCMQETLTSLPGLLEKVPDSIATKRPEPAKWSVSEIIAHLSDTELAAGFRFRHSWPYAK